MTRSLLLTSLCAATLLSACISEERVVVPETTGQVVSWETGAPVAGAEIKAEGVPSTVVADASGAFSLPLYKERQGRAMLPVTGVFVDSAALSAHSPKGRAYGFVDFVTISERAEDEVSLFWVPASAPYDTAALTEDCDLTDKEIYALQLLQTPPTQTVRDWYTSEPGRSDAPERILIGGLVRGVAQRCEVSAAQRAVWIEQIDALTQGAD